MGYWLGLELLGRLAADRNPISLVATLVALAFWGLLHRKDTLKNRRNFFVVMTAWIIIAFTFGMMEAYKKSTTDEELAQMCIDEKEAADYKKGDSEDPDSCMARMRGRQ